MKVTDKQIIELLAAANAKGDASLAQTCRVALNDGTYRAAVVRDARARCAEILNARGAK